MNEIFLALLQNIIVPELAAYIKSQFDSTGTVPTEADLRNHLNSIADNIVTKGKMLEDKIRAENPELN